MVPGSTRASGVSGDKLGLYVLHSLRVGGATALMEAGCDELLLRLHGRWKSNACQGYTRRRPNTFVRSASWMVEGATPELGVGRDFQSRSDPFI